MSLFRGVIRVQIPKWSFYY